MGLAQEMRLLCRTCVCGSVGDGGSDWYHKCLVRCTSKRAGSWAVGGRGRASRRAGRGVVGGARCVPFVLYLREGGRAGGRRRAEGMAPEECFLLCQAVPRGGRWVDGQAGRGVAGRAWVGGWADGKRAEERANEDADGDWRTRTGDVTDWEQSVVTSVLRLWTGGRSGAGGLVGLVGWRAGGNAPSSTHVIFT